RLLGGFFWSRFGPTVPCEPASASVWQPVQPAVRKIVLPSVAVTAPPPAQAESVGLPAQRATKAETSVRSFPETRFAGMTVFPAGPTVAPSAHLVSVGLCRRFW